MYFARSEYLNLFWALPVLVVFFYWSFRGRRRKLESVISPSLLSALTREFSRKKAIARALFIVGFFVFGILALARPQWGSRLENVRRQGIDLIVALDTSYSMNAEDISPSRLDKAKSETRSLIEKLKGDRIGLVSFAGTAIVQCPLTLDYGASRLFLDIINTEIIPEPGTSLAEAIKTATRAFSEREKKYKVLVIFTDGEDLEGNIDSATKEAQQGGVIIYTVGIGTPEGRPIPIRDEKGDISGYRKDSGGQVVVSRLDERVLARVAAETGGKYLRATTGESELDEIYEAISNLDKKELESKLFQNFEDQFQYPLTLAFVFLVAEGFLSERRKPRRSWVGRFSHE